VSPQGRVRGVAVRSALLALATLLVSRAYWPNRELIIHGLNDFPAFYTAGSLVGTPDLYHKAAFLSRQSSLVGASDPDIQFVRLPFYAAVFWPLSTLFSYPWAYGVWQAGCALALYGFLAVWPHRIRLLPVFWMILTLSASFANGQDVPFVLLWIALTIHLFSKGRPFSAGLVLSLCLAKFHFFLFVPIALAAKREWKGVLGGVTGVATLILISFLIGGPKWPAEILVVWRDPLVHPSVSSTAPVAAICGLIADPRKRLIFVVAVVLLIGAVVWRICRRVELATAICLAIAGGVLSAFHVYLQDYALCLPLLTVLGTYYKHDRGGTAGSALGVTRAG
jgi:Glycosyltransferase family 87